ncbi:unnamed protein product [Mytilus coruscus]|uniref:ZMYM2-like/QRICH1 C-terminal domain-containing protein n=1 Tax=Mytilus coruscus TaxID=42192 RepID=A0A6J8EEA0_MYTCO|nr:unnamed protein product [Mytilus coruscus]
MDGIDLLEWDPIFLTQSSYSQVSEEKESDILSYFDLKPSDNDLEITRHQFRHGQPETAKSLQNKIEESGYYRHQKSSSINFFTDPEFLWARQVLDAVMKERATEGLGANTRKQADVISVDEETSLYDKGILGVDNPQQLLDTLLYLCGLHFALRGGTEHRRLRLNSNPQITGPFQDKDAKLRYLLYKEDVSKANAGGLKHRKVVPKCVRAFENSENRNKCIVTVFEKYKSLWHVKRLCTSIGLTGKRTNHSLRASAATRLYNAGIEEQRVAETTEASNILYGLRPSDGSKKAKPSAAAGAPVGSASVECSTDESDKKTVTCNFSFNFSLSLIHVK